jgi:hypothetical protein
MPSGEPNSEAWNVARIRGGSLAEPGRHGRAPVVQHVAEHHLGALGDEVPHVRLAHAPGAAGDQRDLPVEPPHGLLHTQRPNACLARAYILWGQN